MCFLFKEKFTLQVFLRSVSYFVEAQVRTDLSIIKSTVYADSESSVVDAVRAICGRGRRVSSIATRVVDNHEDPIFRNGLMVYINQLNKGT